jgi:hypothetical protein
MTQKLKREKIKKQNNCCCETEGSINVHVVKLWRDRQEKLDATSKPCFCHIQPRAISKDSEGSIALTRVIDASANSFEKYF